AACVVRCYGCSLSSSWSAGQRIGAAYWMPPFVEAIDAAGKSQLRAGADVPFENLPVVANVMDDADRPIVSGLLVIPNALTFQECLLVLLLLLHHRAHQRRPARDFRPHEVSKLGCRHQPRLFALVL